MKTIKNIFCAVTRLKNWNKVVAGLSFLVTLAFLGLYIIDKNTSESIMYSTGIDEFLICSLFFLVVLSVVFNLSRIASSLEEIARNTKKKEEM